MFVPDNILILAEGKDMTESCLHFEESSRMRYDDKPDIEYPSAYHDWWHYTEMYGVLL